MGHIVTCMFNGEPHELDDECQNVTYCLTEEDKANFKKYDQQKAKTVILED